MVTSVLNSVQQFQQLNLLIVPEARQDFFVLFLFAKLLRVLLAFSSSLFGASRASNEASRASILVNSAIRRGWRAPRTAATCTTVFVVPFSSLSVLVVFDVSQLVQHF